MDPVNQLSQIIQSLRQRLSKTTVSQGTSPAHATDRQSPPVIDRRPLTRATVTELRDRIGTRIRQLPAEQRTSKLAAQVFVESVLVWEFGDDILQYKKFDRMSTDIQTAITSDVQAWARLQQFLQQV